MSFCAPGKKDVGKTCFTINSLRKIAKAYNENRASSPADKIKFASSTSKDQLWHLIREKLSDQCETEWCWLDIDFVKQMNDDELNGHHVPTGPFKGIKWLNTTDINKAMKLYEKGFSDFVFFGPVPIDFAEIQTELNQELDLSKLYHKGIKAIGIIFNLDPHTKDGSHWVALFIDLRELHGKGGMISYFDSIGVCPPPKEIKRLINTLNAQGKRLFGVPMFVNCNTYRHQFKSTECGVYSMYFITQALKGLHPDDIFSNIILDDEINKYRSVFFRPKK